MVVEKLKEREDKRDAKQDEEALLEEIRVLKWKVNELLNENAHLQSSRDNAIEEYKKAIAYWQELLKEIETLEKKIRDAKIFLDWLLK